MGEAESGHTFAFKLDFDETTRSLRLPTVDGDLRSRVFAYLDEHPDASANEANENVSGRKADVLKYVAEWRERGGSQTPEPPGTTPLSQALGGGSHPGAYKAPGTTPEPAGSQTPEPPPAGGGAA